MGDLNLIKNKKYNQGYYIPINKEKFIGDVAIYRSGLELRYFKFFDNNPNCIKWNSEGVKIPYYWDIDKKYHTYYIDIAATFKEGNELKTYLIEIKPARQTQCPENTARKRKKTLLNEQMTFSKNIAKWTAAKEFAKKNNFKFIILTENEIS